MRFFGASIGFFAVAVGLGGASAAAAQNIVPDSTMAVPSGNTGAANNGIGHEGSLTGNAGSHASTVTGPAAAQLAIHPAPPTSAGHDPQLEKDPTQGGDTRH